MFLRNTGSVNHADLGYVRSFPRRVTSRANKLLRFTLEQNKFMERESEPFLFANYRFTMKNKLKSILFLILSLIAFSACGHKYPPCTGTQEEIIQCQIIREQAKQARKLKTLQIQQNQMKNQIFWDNYRNQYVQ